MTATYDSDNVFAKIIDGTVPSFKVFESRLTLAVLDAFPMVEGHVIVMPKLKGYASFIDMPPARATDFLADLHKVANAVKAATGATGVNIMQNNGEDAGQSVMHPHFHIIPRHKGDNLFQYPASSKEQLSAEAAGPLMAKLTAAMNPPKPLNKAKWDKVASVNPDSKGLNLLLKVVAPVTETETKAGKFFEAVCGDSSGTVIVSLRDTQKDLITEGATLALRNAAVKMVAGHIRLAVDKWGKIEASTEEMEEVNKAADKNMSNTEFELVSHGRNR